MVKKEFNLFAAYKSSSKSGSKSTRRIISLILIFITVVAACYGTILFFQLQTETRISSIRAELSASDIILQQQKLETERQINAQLTLYEAALNQAAKKFGSTLTIDSQLFSKISGCMPADVTVKTFAITPVSLDIACQSTKNLSPAGFTQALRKTGLFQSISYDSVIKSGDAYQFSIHCTLKPKKEESGQ